MKRVSSPARLVVLASAWMATVGNFPLWREMASLGMLEGGRGLLLGVGSAVIVGALLSALASVFAWRWTLKPVLALLLVSAASGLYFMATYRIVIDPTMMTNVLQTDVRETGDLLSGRMALTVLLGGVLPALLLWRLPVDYGRPLRRVLGNAGLLLASVVVAVAVLLACFQPLASLMRNHKQVRYLINPLNSVWALTDVAARPLRRPEGPLRPIGEDARLGTRLAGGPPPVVVLVLGETARAVNFALNGYGRDTTPELARENVVSLRNAWSCGTSTAASVPCMFSHLGREGWDDRQGAYENLLDVLQRAGLAVLWLDNQSGCKGVCERVPNASTASGDDPALCPGGACHDMVMLKDLDRRIAALPPERVARGVVVVMHQMGSHGPAYSKRSPPAFKAFQPECTSNALQECSRESLVNAYDNSIRYTDHFLASTIAWLKARGADVPGALVYLSDHGESLGENNLYLHGLPYAVAPDVQKHVPWITWLSPAWERRSGLSASCLRAQRDERRSHDNLFHSMLGLLDVQAGVYRRELDLYAGCLAP